MSLHMEYRHAHSNRAYELLSTVAHVQVPSLELKDPDLFHQDGAPVRKASSMKTRSANVGSDDLECPAAESPDLNLWDEPNEPPRLTSLKLWCLNELQNPVGILPGRVVSYEHKSKGGLNLAWDVQQAHKGVTIRCPLTFGNIA